METLLAFLTDENGSEEYTVRVKNLTTGEMSPSPRYRARRCVGQR